MDPNQPSAVQPTPQPEQPQLVTQPPAAPNTPAPTPPSSPLQKLLANKRLLIAAGAVLLLLLIIIILMVSGGKRDKNALDKITPTKADQSNVDVQTTPKIDDADNPQTIMLYGTWTGQTSVIKAVDLGSSNSFTVATLPLEVKKVNVLSTQDLIFIDQIDTKDHGKRITVYNIKDKTSDFTIPASSGYGIDDYILSPDKKYLVMWEVSFAQKTDTLLGGKSRVYAVDLSRPLVKNLLYDEQSTTKTPVHYPRAILNDGTVFADTLMPNDPKGGTGWAYGMSVVDFDGTNKRDIPSMTSGTYGTQPVLSPDGKYLLFAGYDGLKGDGNTLVNGYRQAIVSPNTVDVLNTDTLKRFTLPNLSNSTTYTAAAWEVQSGNAIISQVSSDQSQTGTFAYDLGTREEAKIPLPTVNTATFGYVTKLNANKALIGIQDVSPANLGNLGDHYAEPFTQVALLDIPSQKVSYVSLPDTFAQYITVLPTNYFENVLGIKTISEAIPQPTYRDVQDITPSIAPQNTTFYSKNTLANLRLMQQSTALNTTAATTATCEQLPKTQCTAVGLSPDSRNYKYCIDTVQSVNNSARNVAAYCR